MASVRGLVGAMTGIGLNLSFVFLTFADGFTVFKGCALLGSAVGAGFLDERLNWRELCISHHPRRPRLRRAAAAHLWRRHDRRALAAWSTGERAAGIGAATFSGLCDAGFTLLTRQLSREGRPLGAVSPALLLSYFMAATFGCVLVVGVVATATGLYLTDGFGWARLQGVTRHTPEPWELGEPPLLLLALLLLYCVGISRAAGDGRMATTRAGVGAILQVSEIALRLRARRRLLGRTHQRPRRRRHRDRLLQRERPRVRQSAEAAHADARGGGRRARAGAARGGGGEARRASHPCLFGAGAARGGRRCVSLDA